MSNFKINVNVLSLQCVELLRIKEASVDEIQEIYFSRLMKGTLFNVVETTVMSKMSA